MEDHFNGLPGFKSHYLYDDFSTPCFDGRHTMMQVCNPTCIIYASICITYSSICIIYVSICIFYASICIIYSSICIIYVSICIIYVSFCCSLLKGGSWISTGDEASRFARFAFRRHFYQHMGFRVVRSLTSETTPVKLCDLNVYVHGAGVIGIECMGIRLYWYGNEVSK